jgi:primosomal protein N' (replication factor Y)
MEAVISDIERAEPCILVGTQMLAKGHHFSNVTLVAVLDADTGLFSPDFRGHERLAQLLTQVAGRSGRGDSSGRVLIQTYQPQHPLLETLTREGYRAVAAQLMQQRQRNQLPPNAHIALIRAESVDGLRAEEFLHRVRQLMQHMDTEQAALTLIGPLPAMLEKRANRYRFILQISAPRRSILQQSLSLLIREMEKLKYSRQLRWSVDVDPQEM